MVSLKRHLWIWSWEENRVVVSSGFVSQTRAPGTLKKKTGRRRLQQEDCSKKLILISAPKRRLMFGKQSGRAGRTPSRGEWSQRRSPQHHLPPWWKMLEVTPSAQIPMASEQNACLSSSGAAREPAVKSLRCGDRWLSPLRCRGDALCCVPSAQLPSNHAAARPSDPGMQFGWHRQALRCEQ